MGCRFELFALVACSNATVETPAQVVQKLYRARIDGKMSGAPSAEELGKIAPFISAELHALLEKARQVHDSEAKKYPDEKPPFTEGDLFTTLFEGPTSFDPGAAQEIGSTYSVPIQFAYTSNPPPPVKWTDTAVVIRENGHYVVSDVNYGGNWDFGNKGTLIESLKSGIADAAGAP